MTSVHTCQFGFKRGRLKQPFVFGMGAQAGHLNH